MNVGDLFAGIGGFSLGFMRAGFEVGWQVEIDPYARAVLCQHWPEVLRVADVREAVTRRLSATDVISGGDPCQIRCRSRGRRKPKHPDLSGYFLAVVGRCGPRWVVRENVPAPDVRDFAAGLESLGYRTLVLDVDAADFTGQSRKRQFVVGCSRNRAERFRKAVPDQPDDPVDVEAQDRAAPFTACVTAHPRRLAEDNLVWEPDRGLRCLSAEEREALQGFPCGWTGGLSFTRRCMLVGEAVCVPVAEWIAKRIIEAEP